MVKNVPPDYHSFFDVLSREAAKLSHPHWPRNLIIDLENDQALTHSHIHPLSGTELGILRGFLDNLFRKGFTWVSSSPRGTPVLLAKENNGTLQLCVDFRDLNNIF